MDSNLITSFNINLTARRLSETKSFSTWILFTWKVKSIWIKRLDQEHLFGEWVLTLSKGKHRNCSLAYVCSTYDKKRQRTTKELLIRFFWSAVNHLWQWSTNSRVKILTSNRWCGLLRYRFLYGKWSVAANCSIKWLKHAPSGANENLENRVVWCLPTHVDCLARSSFAF